MKKIITVTAAEFKQMGWNIGEEDEDIEVFELTICNDSGARKITAAYVNENNDTVELPEYSFDYYETLADLNDFELLPDFLYGQGAVMYNDDETQKSAIVPRADIHEIIGDTDRLDLAVYASFDELNRDLSNCSFGHVYDEPIYEMNAENEM